MRGGIDGTRHPAFHVKLFQVIPNHVVADDVHVAKRTWPVVTATVDLVVRQFATILFIPPMVQLHAGVVRGIEIVSVVTSASGSNPFSAIHKSCVASALW